ncbi:acyltransferase family protein [Allomesorhizobium camelthorni]|uniref:Acyltransferase n=1 Tax=Allomesorhizobium camelthorni TaxID=475069 RepID=A0A6G4W5J9_9HYPH|nr:acyltransferase [Mesorhizobium camelthorni]NGO50025.1 acyltransferase [Mesorhizobium camelthorni]
MIIKPASLAHDAVAPVGKAMSDRIKIARSLCIFFMTFVHVQAGIAENVYDRDAGFFDIVYFILTRLMGLSSVSLLSVVSGYFIVSSLLKAAAGRLMVSKFRTLVVPLIAWNLLMLALLAGYGVVSGNWKDMPEFSATGMANALLAVTGWPLVVPLWFLRDLFVCCLFAPILYQGLRRFPVATILALVAFTLFGEILYILQRPQLMLFFGLGMWLRIAGASEEGIDRIANFLTIGLVAMAAIFITIRIERILLSEMNDTLRLTLDTLLRVTVAAGFWKLTGPIRRSALSELFIRFEPYAFFLFCSHAILFNFGGIIFRRAFGNYGSDLFPITFFTLPCLAVIAAIIGLNIINRSALLIFLFNAGHRLRSRSAARMERAPAQTR